jgi:hypothetical protein
MPSLYTRIAIVECAEASQLDRLVASGLSGYVVRRLGDKAVVVDHRRLAEVHRLFKRLGQTPRVTAD